MADSVRQSITIPGELARKIKRGAKRQHETFSKALLHYARLGIAEEERAERNLRGIVDKIRSAPTAEAAEAFTDELTEAVFGPQRRVTLTGQPLRERQERYARSQGERKERLEEERLEQSPRAKRA